MEENLAELATPTEFSGRGSVRQEPIAPAPLAERSVTELLAEGEHYLEELIAAEPCSESTMEDAVDVIRALETKTGLFDPDSGKIAFKQGDVLKALRAKLQQQSKRKRFGWKRWCKQHIKCMGFRKIETLIQLAERPDLYPYFFLGVHRLLKLLSTTKNRVGEDRAGDFLREHGIVIVGGQENSPELKAQIDEAIAGARARRAGGDNGQEQLRKLELHLQKTEAAVTAILEDDGLAQQVSRDRVTSLMDKLTQLESSITA